MRAIPEKIFARRKDICISSSNPESPMVVAILLSEFGDLASAKDADNLIFGGSFEAFEFTVFFFT